MASLRKQSTVRDYDDLDKGGSQRSAEEWADLSPGWNLEPSAMLLLMEKYKREGIPRTTLRLCDWLSQWEHFIYWDTGRTYLWQEEI